MFILPPPAYTEMDPDYESDALALWYLVTSRKVSGFLRGGRAGGERLLYPIAAVSGMIGPRSVVTTKRPISGAKFHLKIVFYVPT
jgi:hypothetical protein